MYADVQVGMLDTASMGEVRPWHVMYVQVGAGLPIMHTTGIDLLSTGDKVKKIEGIFSGTLSYIFNTYKPGMFSNTYTYSYSHTHAHIHIHIPIFEDVHTCTRLRSHIRTYTHSWGYTSSHSIGDLLWYPKSHLIHPQVPDTKSWLYPCMYTHTHTHTHTHTGAWHCSLIHILNKFNTKYSYAHACVLCTYWYESDICMNLTLRCTTGMEFSKVIEDAVSLVFYLQFSCVCKYLSICTCVYAYIEDVMSPYMHIHKRKQGIQEHDSRDYIHIHTYIHTHILAQKYCIHAGTQ